MPLPFGLKLKRTRRYTVSSKSCLVTRIQLLNGEYVEFTLSVESTGQECLEAVAQRLELREITYFSLWYYNKQNQQRWIDLEKPLKKQLDKYGLEPTVYFGVVFYVSSVTQLQQEITRYQYYLQLKKDVLEGRIPCSIEQAIHLASLAVQADLGDFNRYDSQEFLQKIVLFPMPWIQDERVVEEATQKVTVLYQNYRGLSAPEAELLYMQEVEKMEGYGEESVQAKDAQSTDVIIGSCLDGIFVKHKNGKAPLIFRWNDINNMTHNKSFFALELANKEDTIQFQTEDMETSKYVFYVCVCPKPQPYMMPPQMHFNGHYTEPYTSSQDNLYINNQNGFYYHSQTSLDRSPHEYNGRIRNGSVYSAQSTSSLNNPQHYLQPSPMSSNPSITGSDLMRPDYVPSHRHSALIPPSYRATPDYETVMRQKNLGMIPPAERQSHSMRNLNIGNSYAYSRPDPLVYSQPEIREHSTQGQYPFHLNYSFHSPSPYPYPTERRPVVGAVSVPELTNVQLQQAQEYPPPNIIRNQVYWPPPPYPYPHPRPANSTPDLSRHLYVSSSNPDLITRRVHHSVQTFQEDSLPVAHSLQEVSEPLVMTRRPHMHKRNSIEIAGLAYGLENMRLKERKASASSAETPSPVAQAMPPTASGSDINVVLEVTKPEDAVIKEDVIYGHKKSLSDATMLVHSSGEEEEFEDDSGRHTPQSQDAVGGPEHHMTPMGRPLTVLTGPLAYQPHPIIRKPEDMGQLPPLREPGHMVPSVSEGDLSGQGRLRQKKDVFKRPVSDVPPARRNIDGLPPAGMKKGRSEVKKVGPLKMAALNGLTLSRMPLPDEGKDDPENTSNDERVSTAFTLTAGCYVCAVFSQINHLSYCVFCCSVDQVTVRGKEWSYIASQGPLSSTCQDFWQMVWEQGVSIIAMVTAEEEGGREKSFRYWPRLGSRHNTVTYGRFKITTRFRTDSGCYATTGLKIKHLLTGQERTVWHLQYTDWPDHGCPEDFKGFLSYLEEIQSVRRHTNSSSDPKNTNLPVLVHCSAGVGRTGVVILSEIMIACLEHNEMLDVPTVLNLLRQQRMMMVQTLSQYTFIYKVLIQFLRNSRLI
uniref:Tyrosine-protein phosphatase non-receptor type n=1 Tax=Cyprinus carpio TaxID=7962 RepID=A0A8C1VPL2_CYPCA